MAIGPVGPAVNWHWPYIFLRASIIHHLLTYMKRRQNMLHFSGMKIRNCRFFEWAPTFFSVGLGSQLLSLPAVSISIEQKTCCKESLQKLTPFLTDTLPLNRRGSSFWAAQFEETLFLQRFPVKKTQRTTQAMHNHNFGSYRFFGTLIILVFRACTEPFLTTPLYSIGLHLRSHVISMYVQSLNSNSVQGVYKQS